MVPLVTLTQRQNIGAGIFKVVNPTTIFHLETSYRCAASICRCATALVAAGGGTEKTLPRPGAPAGRGLGAGRNPRRGPGALAGVA